MSGIGGATSGKIWCDYDFVENHNRIDINALHRVGALRDGAEKVLAWNGGLKGSCRATHGAIFLSVGDREQAIRVDCFPIIRSQYTRPRFLCPGCGAGCYHLYSRAGIFICRRCARLDWKSRHRQRYSNAFRRIAVLRKKLGADPRPLSPIPLPPRQRMAKARWRRLVAELARAEAAAYGDVGRLLADLEQRAKTKVGP